MTAPLAAEPTAIGLQTLVPGIAPITLADRLIARLAAPLEPKRPQRPCDHGLFDTNARNQLDLFQLPPPAAGDGRGVPTEPCRAGASRPHTEAGPPLMDDRRTGAHQGA